MTDERTGLPPPDRGVRLDWADIPEHVRGEVERWLGGAVVSSVTQPTGFSPGVAARLTTDEGRRVFVKAVGPELNVETPAMHRRESKIVPALSNVAPVPQLMWSYDDGEGGWIAMVFEDVDGRHPTRPWRTDELHRVVAAMEDLNRLLTPSPLPVAIAGRASNVFATEIGGWRRLRDEHPSRLARVDEWSRRHLEALVSVEDTVTEMLEGNTLLHMDFRADNILLTPERVWFVDWPQACIGPAWLDAVAFAPSVTMQGGPPPEELISMNSACLAADGAAITAAVVALAGYFTHKAVQPPPPGLPTVRAFQGAQGFVARQWAAQRMGLR